MKLVFFQQFFVKYSYFIKIPSSRRQVIPCGQTNGRTDMTKLIVVFRNFANAPKNAEALVVASKGTALEINTDKTKYMVMSRDQNAG